jgi:hypothetical protein
MTNGSKLTNIFCKGIVLVRVYAIDLENNLSLIAQHEI